MFVKLISASLLSLLIFASCSSTKHKTTTATTVTTAKIPVSIVPATEQLKAIQVKYPDVTMQTLTEGHSIFVGACTNCHGQYNIYKRSEASWLHEIDDMSPKARLTASQKDALTKYVLSMKYVQVAEIK